MKNNFIALIFHFVIVILSTIFLIIFVVTGPKIGQYTTHIISRLFIVIAIILLYIFIGTLLDINASKKYDFFAGSFIGIIGIALWFYTFSMTGENLLEITSEIPEELGEYWILMNIYHTPFIFLRLIFRLPNIPLLSLLANLFPTLLIGLGLKYKRLKNIKIKID